MCVWLTFVVSMNEFMGVLDRRLEKGQQRLSGIVAKKVRMAGVPSSSQPPPGAPTWAVKKNVQGIYIYF